MDPHGEVDVGNVVTASGISTKIETSGNLMGPENHWGNPGDFGPCNMRFVICALKVRQGYIYIDVMDIFLKSTQN